MAETPRVASEALSALVAAGIELSDFAMGSPSLEEVFFALTGSGDQGGRGMSEATPATLRHLASAAALGAVERAELLAIGFGLGWVFIVLGLLIRTPMSVMTLGFTVLFPVVFASNIMVEPETMPDWLRAFVEANPISLMTTAMRGLMAGTATLGQIGLALVAPVLLTVVLAPLTLWLYRRT